ncbi:glycerophosphodiester phosphodiesterase [Vulgatibacter incomptus]|nr:glycerophosphodiester phosphodiesterase family protein [Vulgatibacter incomptus]
MIYAHRGASAMQPENTCAAFALASRQGADGIECDVMRARTGELVVCHDERLDRLAGLSAEVRDLSLEELRQVKVLADRFAGTAETVPTLEEAVGSAGPDLVWNVELKVDRDEEAEPLARAAVRELERLPLAGRVIVSSFHPLALLTVRKEAPSLPTAYLWEGRGAVWHALWGKLCGSAALHPEASLVTEPRMRAWHGSGKLVNVWTVDDPDELRRLSSLGVDGVITNRPDVALEVLRGGGSARSGRRRRT